MEQPAPLDVLPLTRLEQRCRQETHRYQRQQTHDSRYCLEIFHRALRRVTARTQHAGPLYADEAARTVLVTLYSEFIKATINRQAIYDVPLDDLIQEVWLRFWSAVSDKEEHSFSSLEGALGYLKRVTVTTLIEGRRRRHKYSREQSLQHLLDAEGREDVLAVPDDLFSQLAKRRFRERCEELLCDPLEKHIYWLHASLRLPPREIAKQLLQHSDVIKDRPITARAVSDLLAKIYKRLEQDPEIRELLEAG